MPRVRGVQIEEAWTESGIHYEILRYNLRATALFSVKVNGQETHFRSMEEVQAYLKERNITTRAVAAAGRKKRAELLEEEQLRMDIRKEIGGDVESD